MEPALFKRNTTFVVGAGASHELGLPLGPKLKDDIHALMAPSNENSYGFAAERMWVLLQQRFATHLLNHTHDIQPIRGAADIIRRGLLLAPSIDNFLFTHSDNAEVVLLSKAVIAMLILLAEQQCRLFVEQPLTVGWSPQRPGSNMVLDVSNPLLADTWYRPLAQLLFTGVERKQAWKAFENVRFVIFNYDRCLEQFLYMAVQAHFNLSENEAAKAVNAGTFIHPYGSLGKLPWQVDADGREDDRLAIGQSNGVNLWMVAQRLRTFTETVDSQLGSDIKRAISLAHTVIFMGFGYLEQNVDLLTPDTPYAERMIGTAYGIWHTEEDVLRRLMGRIGVSLGATTIVDNATCKELLEHNRLRLSLE